VDLLSLSWTRMSPDVIMKLDVFEFLRKRGAMIYVEKSRLPDLALCRDVGIGRQWGLKIPWA
jgi:hypothetical protein